MAEAMLTASINEDGHEDVSPGTVPSEERQKQENLLGEVLACRAFLSCYYPEETEVTRSLCLRALTLLAPNHIARITVGWAQLLDLYSSAVNDAEAAIQSGLQASLLAQATGQISLAISVIGSIVMNMIGTGQLHEAYRMTQQAIQLGTLPGGSVLPETGYPAFLQAEILREWNQLDAAHVRLEGAILLCQQIESHALFVYLCYGCAIQLRLHLSCGELKAAYSAFQQFERLGRNMNQIYTYMYSRFTTIDQIRLWLACGELDHATQWAETLDLTERDGTPFAREREDTARVRVLLVQKQPDVALQRLEPVLQRVPTEDTGSGCPLRSGSLGRAGGLHP